jgi:hypothetical protein
MWWHPLVTTALLGAVAAGGVALQVGAVAAASLVGWLAIGGSAGFAVSGST